MTPDKKQVAEYTRNIPALRSGTDGPKAKYLQVLKLDEKEGRAIPGLNQPGTGSLGCFASLGWHVPDNFDDTDDEIADLFEGTAK